MTLPESGSTMWNLLRKQIVSSRSSPLFTRSTGGLRMRKSWLLNCWIFVVSTNIWRRPALYAQGTHSKLCLSVFIPMLYLALYTLHSEGNWTDSGGSSPLIQVQWPWMNSVTLGKQLQSWTSSLKLERRPTPEMTLPFGFCIVLCLLFPIPLPCVCCKPVCSAP